MLNRNKLKAKNFFFFLRKRKLRGSLLWAAILILATFFASDVYASEITPAKILELTNQSRIQEGLPALSVSTELSKAAEAKAHDMLLYDYFAHTSPKGIDPWYWIKKSGYEYEYAGENLAMDFLSAEAVHRALINSATHRANILNSHYKEIGIAAVSGEFENRTTTIVVEMFGSRIVPSATADEADGGTDAVSDSAPKSEKTEKFSQTFSVLPSIEKDSNNIPPASQEPETASDQEPAPSHLFSENLKNESENTHSRLQEPSVPKASDIILVSLIEPSFAYSDAFLDSSLINGFLIKLNEEGMPEHERDGIVKGDSGRNPKSKNFIAINFLKIFNRSNLAFTFLFLYLWIGFCALFEGVIREL